jgi:hypothetical protein
MQQRYLLRCLTGRGGRVERIRANQKDIVAAIMLVRGQNGSTVM